MSDDKLDIPATTTVESLADAQVEVMHTQASAGQMLKQAREASGIHIASLSMALKVPVKKLEALEADDWAQLPDAVFARALTTSVCRHIKADSAPILAALPQSAQVKLIDAQMSKGINQTFRSPSDSKSSILRLPVSMPLVIGALVLLLAATIIILLPNLAKQQEAKKPEIVEPTAMQIQMQPVLVSAEPLVNVQPVVPVAPVANQLPSFPAPSLAVAPKIAATAPETSQVSAVTQPVNSSGSPTLRLVAKGVVWVEVKDAKGVVLVQRTLQPKEVLNINGVVPLAVVVGRINEMQSVDVRGKPFSLAGLSPDNVARFQVK